MRTTTINVKRATLERLMPYGRLGESYDDTINKLIDMVEKLPHKEREELLSQVQLKRRFMDQFKV